MLSGVLLAAATIISLILGMPQAWRIHTTQNAAGLDPTQDLIRVAGKGAWLAYGIGIADWAFTGMQLVIAIPSMVTIWWLIRLDRLTVGATLTTIVSAAAAGAAAIGLGWVVALGYAATVSDIGRYLPQAVRTWTADDLTGVASGTYLLQATASVCWGGYGIMTAQGPLIVGNAVLLPIVVTMWVRVRRNHRQHTNDQTPQIAATAD